ncbi:MAG: DUF4097 family beta strand repeat-containing protein [Limisphaerales bacterium]
MKTSIRQRLGLGLAAAVGLAGVTLTFGDYESNLDKSFPASPGGKLVVKADRGAIDITTGGEQVVIKVFRAVKDGSKADADEVFSKHEVTFVQDGNTVTVNARMKEESSFWSRRRQNLQVHYEIAIPRKFNVDLKTFGGSITVPDLTGEARSETSGGHLKFGRIGGPVWGKTFGGGITVAGADGAVEVTTSGGQIQLGDVGGAASAQTFGGSINVRKVNGAVTAKTSGGGITIDEAGGDLFAQTFGGSIVIGHGRGKVTAKTSGGRITVDEAGANVDAQTFGGSITIKKARGGVRAETSGGGIDVGEAGGTIAAKTFSGSITANLTGQPDDACQLETSGGNIRVRLASSLALDLDAATSGGRVVTNLPVTVQGEQGRGALHGRINGGGKPLKLRTHGGSIYLEKI